MRAVEVADFTRMNLLVDLAFYLIIAFVVVFATYLIAYNHGFKNGIKRGGGAVSFSGEQPWKGGKHATSYSQGFIDRLELQDTVRQEIAKDQPQGMRHVEGKGIVRGTPIEHAAREMTPSELESAGLPRDFHDRNKVTDPNDR